MTDGTHDLEFGISNAQTVEGMPAQDHPEEDRAREIHELKVALAKLAYICARNYSGMESGPIQPSFWLKRVLGEDFDRSILKLYHPTPDGVRLMTTCLQCHQKFEVGVATSENPVATPTHPICTECTPKPVA